MYQRQFTGNVEAFGRVAVLFGGTSAERDISLKSGAAVLKGLLDEGVNAFGIDVNENAVEQLKEAQCDRAFIALHGSGGEDGKIQALLEWLNIPYTGSNVAASAIALNKLTTKEIWIANGLPTPNFLVIRGDQTPLSAEDALKQLSGACFVKPVLEGSSIGMSMVSDVAAFEKAISSAKNFGNVLIAEEKVVGREFTVAILNGQALSPIELKVKNPFYDYQAKYFSDETEYFCPADISDVETQQIQRIAKQAFECIGCAGWGRIDFMQDNNGKFYLLEANTVPGMTSHSLVPMAAKVAGLSFNALLLEILSQSM